MERIGADQDGENKSGPEQEIRADRGNDQLADLGESLAKSGRENDCWLSRVLMGRWSGGVRVLGTLILLAGALFVVWDYIDFGRNEFGLLFQQTYPRVSNGTERPLRMTLSSCKHLHFRLILAFSRPELDELMDRLRRVEMMGCTVHLQFVVPDEMEDVAAFADQLSWHAGKVYTHTIKGSFKEQTLRAWRPESIESTEFAVFIDMVEDIRDDMLKEALSALTRHFVDGKERIITRTGRSILGLALDGGATALKQRPATIIVFFPWMWSDLQRYIDWRIHNETPPLYATPLMDTFSWRQYLWEYLILDGKTLLSPGSAISPLKDIPVFDCLEQQVDSVRVLAARRMERQRNDYPGIFAEPEPAPKCILDLDSDPIDNESVRRRYLLYEPHGTPLMQLETLQKALLIAPMLNRTLIVPPLLDPRNPGQRIEYSDLFVFNTTASMAPLSAFPSEHFVVRRQALMTIKLLPYRGLVALPAPLFAEHGVRAQTVVVPVITATDSEVVANFGACRDVVLAFRSMNFIVDTFSVPADLEALQTTWTATAPFIRFLDQFKTDLSAPIVCTIFSRGADNCGADIRDDPSQKLLYYRSCHAGPGRLLDYTHDAARKAGIGSDIIYMIMEAQSEESPDGVVTLHDLEVALGISGLVPNGLVHGVASMLERMLCNNVQLFVNNHYSPVGRWIAKHRQQLNLPTVVLGA
ncbi:hypothetical protein PSACC_00116 [Paramicrosporidium saccamoebae]|uniref:Uncharacterized protein n=1 Tax=Paramicrosporidium saccamoebae TaxID=1246581 RepID=A0A2H9TQN0_9FUNG|nr:hypothetical protein PSACC_00116 [Paramicrosporidium saccamoebae]